MSAPTRLLLVRHGQTVWHRENRYAGNRSDIDLTADGHAQARTLAGWALGANVEAVVSSPVRRALETSRPVAASLGLDLVVDPELREVDFGVAEGQTLSELRSRDATMVERFTDDPARHPFPDAEPPDDAAARGAHALRHAAGSHSGGRVLIVAHNTLLRLALCHVLDLPVSRYRQLFPRLDNGAVTEIRLTADPAHPASLIRLNDHLAPVADRHHAGDPASH